MLREEIKKNIFLFECSRVITLIKTEESRFTYCVQTNSGKKLFTIYQKCIYFFKVFEKYHGIIFIIKYQELCEKIRNSPKLHSTGQIKLKFLI